MHLEKVTTRSSEAGLAGWIASNDATLFTMVLVVAIAIFLHSRLIKGTREQDQLAGENSALAANLQSTSNELDAASELLDKTNKKLSLTQDERDQLQQQLAEKLSQLAELNQKLELTLTQKTKLESQRKSLAAAKASLTADRTALSSSNATLRDRLDLITAQLADKVAALAEVEKQRDRLQKQADELDAIVATLRQKLQAADVDLASTRQQAEALRTSAEGKLTELEQKAAASEEEAEKYLAQLRRAAEALEELKLRNERLQGALTHAELQHQQQLLEEGRNNRELVGLKGRLERVAVVVDASGSMKQMAAASQRDRWQEAQQIVATWLQHLNVQQCVLIVFSSDVRAFPGDGSLVDLRGDRGKANRQLLLERLKATSPAGYTNTLEGLRKAYAYNVDTILLFSDGAPSKSDTGAFDPALANEIYELCRQHPGIPVNTIGLGNYFDKNMSTFLRTVAGMTGGTFRGQ